jgi:glycosyltransferase involved in cell wall biosynthesis
MAGRPSVCLAMIVRNERGVIGRCLDSVRGLIDSWVICDTGSTDGTQAYIQDRLGDLPGVLYERPWKNFGANRSELLDLARSHGDYLLLLDADMTVEADRRPLTDLSADAYLIRLVGDVEYWMPYLVKSSLPWYYVGVTHEYLALDQPHRREKLESVRIYHHADGGSRRDKFERDRALLEAEVARNPDDARSVFYLAQTYRDLGQLDEAVEWYRRRAAMGGWDEEVFYALYQVGVLLAASDWQQAVPALLEAWNSRPTRAEPLYDLAVGFRQRGQYALAHWAAERGLRIRLPSDILFVSRWVYDWGLLFEYSIAAYWVGQVQEALAACERLLADRRLPEPWRTHARQNRDYCRAALARARLSP